MNTPNPFTGFRPGAGTLCLAGLLLATMLSGAEPASEGASLRAMLREKVQALQTAQSDLAALQATQPTLVEENKALSGKYDALKKQLATDRAAAEKTFAGLSAQNAEQKAAIARLTDALEQAKANAQKTAQTAQAAAEQNAKLAQEKIVLERRLADHEGKNLALFVLGNQILTRYEEFSLGNALRAKEPFVGLTRTKLENLVQDYQDKLLDQRIKP